MISVRKAKRQKLKREVQEITCIEEYDDHLCFSCRFMASEPVGHPGGSSVHSVERHYCNLDFWREDF